MDNRTPQLLQSYQAYLSHEDSARFIRQVARHYTHTTLERLAAYGSRAVRRAAILGLGYLSNYQSNATVGPALRDDDRGVRLLAENAAREIWRRDGTPDHQQQLNVIIRWNQCGRVHEALESATRLIDQAPWFAEAWNQRAVAWYQLREYNRSADDCQQTLELNPYHFAAAVGMGHCYLEMNDAFAALECFRRALTLYPDLEGVRAQISYLQRTLEGR